MSGIYIHIPFCKQACHYCDFHFSTSLKNKELLVKSLVKEIELRKQELNNQPIQSIYFGGGTPSLLSQFEIDAILNTIYKNLQVQQDVEITLEANPDDLTLDKIKELKSSVNRLSIGIQSFIDRDLQLMNRAHTKNQALISLADARTYFDNISVDLIYGIQNSTHEDWIFNIKTALSFDVPHISSYALTVEPKTALAKFIEKQIIANVDDEQAQHQFHILIDVLEHHNFIHYETSNFGKEGFFSVNNTAYWQGKSYLGIGPSAHSFNGFMRSWNVSNNSKYIKSIQENILPIESEILTKKDRFNEYIMTGLRTIWGVSLAKIQADYGEKYVDYLQLQSKKYVEQALLMVENDTLKTTKKGKFLSDGIAADLFMLHLK